MDHELAKIVDFHPSLKGRFRRDRHTGCFEYVGPPLGNSDGNPLVLVNSRGRKSTILLRRWIWQYHHGKLPPQKYIFMSCKNFRCHALDHMSVVSRFCRYRNNSLISNKVYSTENILLVRYFQNRVSLRSVSNWTKINQNNIYSIWRNELFPEIQLPDGYSPPDYWGRKAEMDSFHSKSGHYLGPKNQKKALSDIERSSLTNTAKKRLRGYVWGEDYIELGQRFSCDYTSVRESIQNALLRLRQDLGRKEWLRLLLKRSSRV